MLQEDADHLFLHVGELDLDLLGLRFAGPSDFLDNFWLDDLGLGLDSFTCGHLRLGLLRELRNRTLGDSGGGQLYRRGFSGCLILDVLQDLLFI